MKPLKHAVIIAHPDPHGFTGTMGRTYAAAARGAGDRVVVRDLYDMDFDPRLQLGELARPGYRPAQDVAEERAVLKDANVFALFYPLWFNAPPAILKGYIDRVFSLGFGFRPEGGGQAPQLSGRKLISFTVSGAPDHWVRETGAMGALYALVDKHLAAMCGLTVVAHHHFGGVTPGYPQKAVNQAKDEVRAAVRRYFAEAHA